MLSDGKVDGPVERLDLSDGERKQASASLGWRFALVLKRTFQTPPSSSQLPGRARSPVDSRKVL